MAFDHRRQLLQDLKWADEHDGLDNRLAQSLARAAALDPDDKEIQDMFREQIHAQQMAHVIGQIPPFKKSRLYKGDISFGRDVLSGEDVRVPLQWLAAGVLLCGGSGAGKTLFLVWLVLQIVAANVFPPCRVWISDMYRTQLRNLRPLFRQIGLDLIVYGPENWKWNPLEPDGCHPQTWLNTFVDIFSRRLGLPPRSRITLQQGCHSLYENYGIWDGRSDAAPCPQELYNWVYKAPASTSHPFARDAILDRFGGWITAIGPKSVAYHAAYKASDLAKHSTVIEMLGTTDQVSKIFLESHTFAVLRREMEQRNFNSPLDLFIIVDDGQRFFDAAQPTYRSDDFQSYGSIGEVNPTEELLSVIRGCGKGMLVSTQSLVGLSRRLIPNLATKIIGRSSSYYDTLRLGQDMGMSKEQIDDIQKRLQPGMFLVQPSEGSREPCLVSVPLLSLPNVVSDEEAADSMKALDDVPIVPASEYEDWQPEHIIQAMTPKQKKTTTSQDNGSAKPHQDAPLPMELLEYLKSIARKPFLNATERDKDNGVTTSKGNNIRRKLIEKGLVNPISINPGTGRGRSFRLLELTEKGIDLMGEFGVKPSAGHGRGKLAHRFWVDTISKWLNSQGIESNIEDDSLRARVDISATTNNQKIAIEIEMSRGHELENVRKDLQAGFNRVVSLVNEPAAVERVKAKIEKELGSPSGSVHVGNLREYADIIALALS